MWNAGSVSWLMVDRLVAAWSAVDDHTREPVRERVRIAGQ